MLLAGALTLGLSVAGGAAFAAPASAYGPFYFCNTPDASTTYRTLAPGQDCQIAMRTITNITGYAPFSTVQGICAAPTYSSGSSAGIDCGYGTSGGAVYLGSGAYVYPRIKALQGNSASAQFRGSYYTP